MTSLLSSYIVKPYHKSLVPELPTNIEVRIYRLLQLLLYRYANSGDWAFKKPIPVLLKCNNVWCYYCATKIYQRASNFKGSVPSYSTVPGTIPNNSKLTI